MRPRSTPYRGQTGQVSNLGILVPEGASVFTFENSKAAPALPRSTPIHPLPQKATSMFDAPSVSSTLNSNQKRSASHQAGSNPLPIQTQTSSLFSAASVVGTGPRQPLSSGQLSGKTNAPSHNRVKAAPPHLQPAPGRLGPVPWGSASGSDVTQPFQSGVNQKRPSGTSQLGQRTPQPQPDFRLIFSSDVIIKIAAANADGTVPTSGKVFLYTHPTVDGWVIWELQRDNSFVTRDDVRVFTDTFGQGSSKILRRKADNQTPPIITNNLLFPSKTAAVELERLLVEYKQRMDHVNAPRFEEQNFKAQIIGGVDVQGLRELHPTPKSPQMVDQSSTKDNSQDDAQAVPKATNAAQNHKHGDDQKDNTIPPHKRSAKKALPVQNSETIERNSSISSNPMQNCTSSLHCQEDTTPSLLDMTSPANGNVRAQGAQASPMPTKLIKIEADDKGKRPASEDLRDITYEAASSSARAEPANKHPSPEASEGPFQQSSRSNLNMAKPIDSTDVKTSMHDTLEQQQEARPGHIADTEYLDNQSGGENVAVQEADDQTGNPDTTTEINKLGNNLPDEPQQSTEQVLTPVPKATRIQLHDVERMLPVGNMSPASKNLWMGMTKGKYHGIIESAKGLSEAFVKMDLFTDRRLENAVLMATLQALCQNLTFGSFNDDDKLNTVAIVYEKVYRGVTGSRISYTIDQLLDLNGERHISPRPDVNDLNAMVEEENYIAPRVVAPSTPCDRQNIIRVAETTSKYLNPPTPTVDQAVTLPSPLNLPDTHSNPGRLTPPPDCSEPREQQQQVAGLLISVSDDEPVQSSPLITAVASAPGEVNTLGQKPGGTEKATKQEVDEPVIKTDSQPEASSFASRVTEDDVNQQSQTSAKHEKTSFTPHSQIPSQLTPAQSSQVPSSRTGSQGLRNVLPDMRGIRHNLGAAGLLGSRWA